MLAFSEGQWFPQILIVPGAVAAYYLTDRMAKWQLPVVWAGTIGLIAIGIAIGEVIRGELAEDLEARLVSGAHLLVYFTLIFLFQKKEDKHFWFLCALAVLQVAIGSVLTRAGWYGVLLFLFFFGAIWTLSIFSLYVLNPRASMLVNVLSSSSKLPGSARQSIRSCALRVKWWLQFGQVRRFFFSSSSWMTSPQSGHFCQSPSGMSRFLSPLPRKAGFLKMAIVSKN